SEQALRWHYSQRRCRSGSHATYGSFVIGRRLFCIRNDVADGHAGRGCEATKAKTKTNGGCFHAFVATRYRYSRAGRSTCIQFPHVSAPVLSAEQVKLLTSRTASTVSEPSPNSRSPNHDSGSGFYLCQSEKTSTEL